MDYIQQATFLNAGFFLKENSYYIYTDVSMILSGNNSVMFEIIS